MLWAYKKRRPFIFVRKLEIDLMDRVLYWRFPVTKRLAEMEWNLEEIGAHFLD